MPAKSKKQRRLMALAEKFKNSGALTVVFIGDGTLGEGVVYEALNLASLWKTPILFVVENNHIAQTTPIEHGVAGSIIGRFTAFGIPGQELDTSDVLLIREAAAEQMEKIRKDPAPQALILETCRFGPHSKGDDTRPADQIAALRVERDPLSIHGARLAPGTRAMIEAAVDDEIQRASELAMQDPFAEMTPGDETLSGRGEMS